MDRAYRYCERIAACHYENFPVASWLLPPRLRPHVAAVYAFARVADDFADEARYQGQSLKRLENWRKSLWECAAAEASGAATHPIFIALAKTLREHRLPVQLLDDLLTAFTMDVTRRRVADWEELLTYCRYSANPVGRLVLALFGIRDPQLERQSDCLCTGLQLTNHWQDLGIDAARGMFYVPQTLLRQFQVTEEEIQSYRVPATGPVSDRFRGLMTELVSRARRLFDEAEPLPRRVPGRLKWELQATLLGGRSILDRIEAAGYDVFRKRPSFNGLDKIALLTRSFF